jgi:hypothetical protein
MSLLGSRRATSTPPLSFENLPLNQKFNPIVCHPEANRQV